MPGPRIDFCSARSLPAGHVIRTMSMTVSISFQDGGDQADIRTPGDGITGVTATLDRASERFDFVQAHSEPAYRDRRRARSA